MTNQIQPTDQADALSDEITLHVQRYNPRMLTAGQRTTMLDDIRVAVLKSEPPNKELAGNWLSVLCKFIAQSTPAVGGQFTDYFTDARIEAWVNGSLQRNTPPHTLRSNKGLLARIRRAHQGLPVRMAHNLPTAVATPPLSNADLALIKAGCIAVGLPALRGFIAGFCAGVVDDSGDGARFERNDQGMILRMVDGRELPLLASPVDLEMVRGTSLRDGDWREVRAIANELKIHLDSKIATRTFRSLIDTEPEPFAVLVARFGLTERSVSSFIDHLPPVEIIYDATIVATLRGDRDVPLQPLVAQESLREPSNSKRASAPDRQGEHRLPRPPDLDRGRGGPTMTSRISRTKAQRLAAEARTKAAEYPEISDTIRAYISGYRPAVIDDDTWAAIGPELREAMLRAGYLGQNHVRKMCSALSCYLGWRLAQRLPVAMDDALNDDAIDQFYLRGMSDLGDRHYHYKDVVAWKDQLTARGIKQHHDLREDEQGIVTYERIPFIGGCGHCRGMALAYEDLRRCAVNADEALKEAYRDANGERQKVALRVVNQPDQKGAVRLQCPALAGTVGCSLRPGTVAAAISLGLPIIENPPNEVLDGEPLPRCCTQQTVKVTPPDAIRKLQQPYYHGSGQWEGFYGLRTYVEGSYGGRKNTSTENLRRGLFQRTGLPWANLVVSLTAASYNLRLVQNWHERSGDGDPNHPLLKNRGPVRPWLYLTEDEVTSFEEYFRQTQTRS